MPDRSFFVRLVVSLITAIVAAFASTPLVKRLAYGLGAIDVPKDNRRMHKIPIPRRGGLAILCILRLSFPCCSLRRSTGRCAASCSGPF